ncbi:GNAT family N-acetyltransferase [Arthrobacter jiangjiafuii]|uniref:GNAT family N-acetyltransferase n=1 Tax=Arthrobacter jiangjiafuii TaxID=2817475 RepID=A0A975R0J6_9MICC|nr:GNAT family N-acetyltransferase [Arthrobacter jiangjiafuii]MBP3042784.1 GNAT family N-acetyltransferase [Arthrobacter jiangjiafuii]QWC09501.1 GNAT family N-acetyltransferase [Arthrobacter jiangjiafuii]
MTHPAAVIAQLAIPATLDSRDPAAADFIAAGRLLNEHMLELWGNTDFHDTPQTQLAGFRTTPVRRRLLFAARSGDEILGLATLSLPLTDNTHSALVNVVVAPQARRMGLGSRLYAAAEQAAAADGRRTILGETDHPAPEGTAAGAAVRPKSGTGAIPSDAAAAFAQARGFGLEQVERISLLELADAAVGQETLDAAVAAAGAGYGLEFWRGPCPEDLVDAYAQLRKKMSTDAPLAGLDLEEEQWDAARVRETERKALEMDAEVLVSVVRHLSSGQLVGHTVLMVFNANPAVAFQDDTLVLREHRGNRLGMLLKAANLVRLHQELPEAARVWTWNAAENGYMLSINDRLGFLPVGWSGEWQKLLPAV